MSLAATRIAHSKPYIKIIFLISHSTECFCGNVISAESVKLSDPQCNYKCSGDAKQLCGGYFTISIFETGIKSN